MIYSLSSVFTMNNTFLIMLMLFLLFTISILVLTL